MMCTCWRPESLAEDKNHTIGFPCATGLINTKLVQDDSGYHKKYSIRNLNQEAE